MNPLTTKWRVGKIGAGVPRPCSAKRAKESKRTGIPAMSNNTPTSRDGSSQQRRPNMPSANPPRHVAPNDSRSNHKEYCRAENGEYRPHRGIRHVRGELFECISHGGALGVQKLNSATALIQRQPRRLPHAKYVL